MRPLRRILVTLGLLAFAGAAAPAAFAHGGNYQPPPDPPPRPPDRFEPSEPRQPEDPPPPSDPPPETGEDVEGPASPGGEAPEGPSTPGGETPEPPPPPPGASDPEPPSTGGKGPVAGPPTGQPRGVSSGRVGPDHWSRWWFANRSFLVDLSARAWETSARTPGSRDRGVDDALWRAELQGVLAKHLGSKDEDIASGSAIALGKSGDPSHAPALVQLLTDQKRQRPVREAAALALGLLPASSSAEQAKATREALEAVAGGRKEPNRLRGMAAYALGMRGDIASLPFLLQSAHTNQPTFDLQAAGLTALGLTGNGMIRSDLESVLRKGKSARRAESTLRVYAAHGLARLGSPKAIPALREAARDRDEDVRRAAVLALGALTNEADDATADLLVRLIARDKDRGVRNMAVLALARSGHVKAAPALRHAYKKGDRMHQPFAALALGLLARRTGDAELVEPLARDLKRRANADLRGALVIAVGLGQWMDAAPLVREIVNDRGDPVLRSHAALALGLMGDRFGGPGALRPLLADARDPSLKREAALALGLLGDRKALDLLTKAVESGDSVYVRGSAAVALGRIGGRDAGRALRSLLEDTKRPAIGRGMAAVGIGLLLDRTQGRGLARLGADLNWYVQTATIQEVLTIL